MPKLSSLLICLLILSFSSYAKSDELSVESIAIMRMVKAFIENDHDYVMREWDWQHVNKSNVVQSYINTFLESKRPLSDFCLFEYIINSPDNSRHDGRLVKTIVVCRNYTEDLDIGMDIIEFNDLDQIKDFNLFSIYNLRKHLSEFSDDEVIKQINLGDYFSQ